MNTQIKEKKYKKRIYLFQLKENEKIIRIDYPGNLQKIEIFGPISRKIQIHFKDPNKHDFFIYYYRKDNGDPAMEIEDLSIFFKEFTIEVERATSAPRNLTATIVNSKVKLEWEEPLFKDNDKNYTYEIYRIDGPPINSNPKRIGTTLKSEKYYEDNPSGSANKYIYGVVAVNNAGMSARSNTLIYQPNENPPIVINDDSFSFEDKLLEIQMYIMEEI